MEVVGIANFEILSFWNRGMNKNEVGEAGMWTLAEHLQVDMLSQMPRNKEVPLIQWHGLK